METQLDIRSEKNIGSTCTPFSFDDEPIVGFETLSHSVGIALQFGCSKFGPKLEGDHLKNRVHFGQDRLSKGHLQMVDIEEVPLPGHSPVGMRLEGPQLEVVNQFHANMNGNRRE